VPKKKTPSVVEYVPEKEMVTIEPPKNNSNHRRLEKIKKSIKQE